MNKTTEETHTPEIVEDGLSLKETKELERQEIEQKTSEVFTLHTQILDHGKKSLELAIKAGEILHDIKSSFQHGKGWTEWCRVNTGEKFGVQTMRRYMRLATQSKESPLIFIDCESLTAAYIKCGILTDNTDTTPKTQPTTDGTSNGQSGNGNKKPRSESERVTELVLKIKEILNGIKDKEKRKFCVGLIESNLLTAFEE